MKLKKIRSFKSEVSSTNPEFKALRWRLLGAYLIIMVAIQSISNLLVYQFFANNLRTQIDHRLSNLAQAAAHSLAAIKQDTNAVKRYTPRPLDQDGDLDIPWEDLREPLQSVEWFDANEKQRGIAGKLHPNWELRAGFQTIKDEKIRTLTVAVYNDKHPQLEGYVRVSESTESLEAVLNQLSWGFSLGGIVVLGLIGIGGMWLTGESLKPIEESYEQLKQFTTDASHELRSPLTVIKTSVEVMQTHPERIDPADVEKLGAVVSATNQMSHLVENLLLLARSDRVTVDFPQNSILIPLEELLEDVVAFLDLKAEQKNISIKENWDSSCLVKGEAAQLHRLFSNLLDNALEYTLPGGTVTVSLRKNEKFALVKVEDTGIGIAPQDLTLVFSRFWRSEAARLRREDGSGLGLAIATAIAKKHGGEITVTSKVGVGSCFQVRLPLA
jgi:signal transduction histidine kinase